MHKKTIRDAIREVLQHARIAKFTANREAYAMAREWLKRNLRYRNSGMFIYMESNRASSAIRPSRVTRANSAGVYNAVR